MIEIVTVHVHRKSQKIEQQPFHNIHSRVEKSGVNILDRIMAANHAVAQAPNATTKIVKKAQSNAPQVNLAQSIFKQSSLIPSRNPTQNEHTQIRNQIQKDNNVVNAALISGNIRYFLVVTLNHVKLCFIKTSSERNQSSKG